jgi:hypothetical protein
MTTIITLCGSSRFKDEFNEANARLTMEGNLVISLGVFGHTDLPDHHWTTGGNADKLMLDELHKHKIDLADEILVINVGGYIGESTRGEIAYARSRGKAISYLEPVTSKVIWILTAAQGILGVYDSQEKAQAHNKTVGLITWAIESWEVK